MAASSRAATWRALLALLLHVLAAAPSAAEPIVAWQLPALLEFKAANLVNSMELFLTWEPKRDCADWANVVCEGGQVVELSISNLDQPVRLTEGLSNIISLRKLILVNCGMKGRIPSSLGKLVNLVILDLGDNQLTGQIPAELGDLVKAQEIYLNDNKLFGSLPSNFGNKLNELIILHLYNNRLTGPIPDSLGNATMLTDLSLYNNLFTGSVPSSFGNLVNLVTLSLQDNALDGTLPATFGNMVNLASLNLANNFLTGELPANIWNLTKLGSLWISYPNNLYGSIPPSIGNMIYLSTLDLSSMSLNGSIPASLSALQNLYSLQLSGNSLSGPIPENIGNMTGLNFLDLSSNQLTGNIPSSIGNCIYLNTLALNNNKLSGRIPDSIGRLTNLNNVNLRNNSLNGTIPATIKFIANLQYLYLDQNQLSGSIPVEIGKFPYMYQLNLANNSLSGVLPASIGDLISLHFLSLSYNNLVGPIPTTFSKLSSLQYLYLQGNRFNGSFPTALAKLPIAVVHMSNNQLTGTLPQSIVPTSVGYMDLSYNQLTGTIPRFPDCCSWMRLYFNNNNFSGAVPVYVGYYTQNLDLSFNRFTSIPTKFLDSYAGMTSLYLNDNELVGTVPTTSLPSVLWLQNNFLTGQFITPDYHYEKVFVDLRNNYFNGTTTFDYWNDGGDSRYCQPAGALANNCLFSEDLFCPQDTQRSLSECIAFCNTTQPLGACSSQGTCLRTRASPAAACSCVFGYNSFINSGICVAVGTKGTGLAPSAITTPRYSDRFYRYSSLGYSAANGRWSVPPQWSWAEQGGAGSVRDQKTCWSSWAFATISSMETAIYIANGGNVLPKISVQQILDCQGTSKPCSGGSPIDVLEYAAGQKLTTEVALPYTGTPKACNVVSGSGAFGISSYEKVRFFGLLGIFLALLQGPVIVNIDASALSFIDYKGGYIYDDPTCYKSGVNHNVVVLGYNLTTTPPYMLIKNSWSNNWGEGGFMRISIRGGVGTCGMFSTPALVPIVKGSNPCGFNSYGAIKLPNNSVGAGTSNPCGGGTCTVSGLTNVCLCPADFAAANNSDGSQTCIPASTCASFSSNPCGVGLCLDISSSPGAYTCLCPSGFSLSQYTLDGSATCRSGVPPLQGLQSFSVPAGPIVTCDLLADVHGISISAFIRQQRPSVNCSNVLPASTLINITNSWSCSLPYTINQGDTCTSIAALFNLPAGTVLGGTNSQNPNLNCTNPLQGGKQICITRGTPLENPLCNASYVAGASDTCASIVTSLFNGTAAKFYAVNPAINCARLVPPTSGVVPFGQEICTSATTFEAIARACTGSSKTVFTVASGDTCLALLAKWFKKDQAQFKKTNLNWACDDNKLVVGASLCRAT